MTIDESKTINAKTIIISTGASAKYLGLPSEKRLIGGGVSACAVCDGFFYKNQKVAIVGGGDTAAEEATYLANICSNVVMIIRRNEMRASKAMQHRVNKTKNIEIMYETEISEVLGEKVVEAVEVINNKTKVKKKISVSGLFIAIGHKPNTDIFRGQVDMDDLGYILTNLVSLPQVMFRIMSIDKPLLRQEQDAWQLLTQKDTLDLFSYFLI